MLRDSFLHFLFGGKSLSDKSNRHELGRRTLNLEPLEDRQMLSVSFDDPTVSDYVATSTGAVNPSLVEHRLLFAGDFNNDGKADILAIENSRAYSYLNSGNSQNAFPESGKLATSQLFTTTKADVGKVTGGTHLDLLSASVTDNIINFSVFGGRGDGGFYNIPTESSWSGLTALITTTLTGKGVTIPPTGTLHTTLGDIFLVENNGSLDLVCTVAYVVIRADSTPLPSGSGTINLLFANNGSGKFTAAPTVIATGDTGILAAGDLTGNARPDYVTRNSQDAGKLDIYLNNGTKITTESLGYEIGRAVVAKCHSGTKMEIIAAVKDANGNNFLRVVTVNGTSATSSALYALDIVPSYIISGDFDNDGRLDIFISNGSIHQTLLGQSNGSFTKQAAVVSSADFMAVYSADFNGDGNIDVLAVGKRFAWLIPGDTSKTAAVVVDFANYNLTPKDIAFGDFNGDGKIDFAVLNHIGNEVHVFNQSSSSTTSLFTKAAPLAASNGKQLLVANFDNANGDDIVIYGVDGAGRPIMQTYLSNATGGFSAVKTTTLTFANDDTYHHLAVGDANGNGHIDIVAVYNGSVGTTTTRNSYYQVIEFVATDGSFKGGTKGEISTIVNPTAVAIADMNGNGKNDLVILDAASKSVWILPQVTTSPGSFVTAGGSLKSFLVTGSPVDTSVENSAFSRLAIADFNNDGTNDVLVGVWTTSGDLTFRVMENDPANQGTLKTATPNITYIEDDFVGANASGLAFHVGRLDDNATPDVVFVGGNTVQSFLNADKSGGEIGTVTLVIRDYSSTIVNTEIVDLNTLTDRLSYIDEWSNFWVEIWANTGISSGISSFTTSLNFNADVFEVRPGGVAYATSITGATPVIDNSTGTITLSGSVSGSRGANANHTLLARVSFMPVDGAKVGQTETKGILLNFQTNTGGIQPIANGFSLDVTKSTVTTSSSVTGIPTSEMLGTVPLFPVIYDINDDGTIDGRDFTQFVRALIAGSVSASTAPVFARLCDYNLDGVVDGRDFTAFSRNFANAISRDACRTDPTLKVSYPAVLLQVPIAPVPVPAMPAFFAGEVFEEIADNASFHEPMIQLMPADQSPQNQALMAFIDSQETKHDDFNIDSLNPISETERLLAEGKL